jgi:hexosaminidase
MAAIAEVVWTPKESRSWDDFSLRVPFMMKRYEGLGYAYSRSGYLVNMTVRIDSASRRGTCTLSAEIPSASIRYTLSGKDPDARSAVYAAPIAVDSNVTIRAGSFSDTGRVSPVTEQQIVLHRACFKPVRLAYPAEKYGTGPDALTNGIRGTRSYSDGNWLGFHGVDVDATVDLGSMQSVRRCETNFLQNVVSWIFLPSRVEYSVSDDGVTFRTIGTIMNDHPGSDGPMGIHPYALDGTDIRARYVRVMAKTIGLCPDWHPGKGERSWLFIDEIVVE